MTWRSIGVTESNEVLQQKFVPEQDPSKLPQKRNLVPTDKHRAVPLQKVVDDGED